MSNPNDRFEIIAADTTIGWTHFEHGDPPMGVVFGRMTPTDPYFQMAPLPDDASLSARTPEGELLEPNVQVYIEDFSEELDEIQITILGLDDELYERHFPHHIERYESRFR